MLLCIEYGILFVDTVDTKQCYCVLSRVSCLSTLSIQRIKACNAFNALFVDTVDTKIKCYCVLSRVSCLSTLLIQRSNAIVY